MRIKRIVAVITALLIYRWPVVYSAQKLSLARLLSHALHYYYIYYYTTGVR